MLGRKVVHLHKLLKVYSSIHHHQQLMISCISCPVWILNVLQCCRANIEDALEKIQSALDRAADSIIPIEEDPEKKKQMAKQ